MIHPTAVIDVTTELGEGVEVGPYSVIGPHVSIGRGTRIGSHVVIEGPTRIGEENHIYQFASIGAAPQDKKFKDEHTELIIGDRNVIREFCTFNRGTAQDKGKTVMGDDNWIMAYVHIAHDCIIGNHTVFANNVTLAGHVEIRDSVILGGFTLVHQFCVVGEFAFTGMGSSLAKDLPPFVMVTGAPAAPRKINAEGLRRHDYSPEAIQRVKEIYRLLYRKQLMLQEALAEAQACYGEFPEAQLMLDFCRQSKRGLVR
uniref:Acyl-[acyl-carrier-protein]--UDP-N-acetylglucosamine O-acyltransferase n=1 Tax=uncultured Thiotrichaceae bacterium TaxID=298394 RepID=A0A6S6SFH6_9GAMM|nr:MAG: Acyl-[acyl-carrier-protein]--UDP-N-acetylglucosamine O-acyltransferase (EC [uncultured Thiotrichaceae bacterium]